MDKALGLAIGLGRVRLGAQMLETKLLTSPGKGLGTIAGPVVGHDTLDRDTQARIVGDRGLEKDHSSPG